MAERRGVSLESAPARFASSLLLVGPVLFTVAGCLALQTRQPLRDVVAGWPVFVAILLIAGGVLAATPGVDRVLFAIAAMLTGVGVFVMTRLEPVLLNNPNTPNDLVARHLLATGLGVLVALALGLLPLRPSWLRQYKYSWLLLTGVLLLLTLLIGEESRGARLWLRFGPVQFQPSELLRITIVAYLAGYLDSHRALVSGGLNIGRIRLPPASHLLPIGMVGAASVLMLVLQNDLGSALLLFGIVISMLYLATGQTRFAWWGGVGFATLGLLALRLTPRLDIRLQNWIDPWVDPLNTGFQQIAAEFAFAAGGILGAGPGAGMPGAIPDVHTDFVFAAIGEELGLAGAVAVIALFMLLVVRGMMIGLRARSGFERLLALGLSTALGLQTLLILGGVTRVLPLTGLTLPFISYGGSAMVTNYAIVGMLLAISRRSALT